MDSPSSKRLTRKDIRQPDRFIDLMGKSGRFLAQKKKLVCGVVAGLLVIFAGLWGWSFYQQRESQIAAGQYFPALELYRTGNYREAATALAQVAAHRRTIYGRIALLHLAHVQVALGEYPKAVETLQEFLRRQSKDPWLRQIGLVNLGYVQEISGRCPEALAAYAEAQKLEGSLKDEATLGEARCGAQSGKPKIALDSYRRYLSTHPISERDGEISLKVQELEAGAAQPPAAK
jgi:predicted negative regulator of RcsB-dependent stress response